MQVFLVTAKFPWSIGEGVAIQMYRNLKEFFNRVSKRLAFARNQHERDNCCGFAEIVQIKLRGSGFPSEPVETELEMYKLVTVSAWKLVTEKGTQNYRTICS